MSRPVPTRGKRARAAENAAASAALAEATPSTAGKREQRRRLEGTIRSVSANAQAWQDHGGFPNAAARAWEIVAEARDRLEALDRGEGES